MVYFLRKGNSFSCMTLKVEESGARKNRNEWEAQSCSGWYYWWKALETKSKDALYSTTCQSSLRPQYIEVLLPLSFLPEALLLHGKLQWGVFTYIMCEVPIQYVFNMNNCNDQKLSDHLHRTMFLIWGLGRSL